MASCGMDRRFTEMRIGELSGLARHAEVGHGGAMSGMEWRGYSRSASETRSIGLKVRQGLLWRAVVWRDRVRHGWQWRVRSQKCGRTHSGKTWFGSAC